MLPELMFQWYFIIKLVLTGISLFIGYKFYKSNFKSKFWGLLTIITIIMITFNPIKLDGTNSTNASKQQVYTIEQNKVIPEKIIDNSFNKKVTSKNLEISKKEIWNK